jgi:uncharacterized membrane protein
MDLISLVSRWTHIGTAIVLVGGTFFLRFVLAPAAAKLADADHNTLKEAVIKTWKKYVHGGIALFLLSGFYNYLVVQRPLHKGQGLYHGLFGAKFLLALTLFFFASALVGRSKAFEGMRKNGKFWQLVMILLAAVIVGISGIMKSIPPTTV